LVTALLAMDARLVWLPGDREVSIGNYLPLRATWEPGGFIRTVDVQMNVRLQIETIARSPMDRAIVCVAVCRWPSGRTRTALGGFGKEPVLAFDGPDPTGADAAARNAYLHAEDAWASAGYRSEMAAALTRRIIQLLENGQGG
jgi:CO/xanthine dehydrogenase FAD-binding subunit